MNDRHIHKKRFGQHFLHDAQVLARIVQAIAPKPGEHVVEIGPGDGALTLPLLRALGRLTVIELDRDLIPRLHAASLDALEAVLSAAAFEGEPQPSGGHHRTTPTLGDYLHVRKSLRD